MGDAAIFAEEEVLKGVTENIMMGQLARVGTGEVDLLLDEQKVVRDAVEVVVDNLSGDKDLGLVGAATPYASTPFQSSPMSGSGAEMTPFLRLTVLPVEPMDLAMIVAAIEVEATERVTLRPVLCT